TDVGENIIRMERVIRQLDLPFAGEKIWLIPLKTVSASEMANMLKEIFMPKGGQGAPVGGHRGAINMPAAPGQPPGAPSNGGGGGGGGGADLSVSLILAEDRSNPLIVVSSERIYLQILGLVHRLDQQGSPMDTASDRVHVYFLANAAAEDLAGTLGGIGIS